MLHTMQSTSKYQEKLLETMQKRSKDGAHIVELGECAAERVGRTKAAVAMAHSEGRITTIVFLSQELVGIENLETICKYALQPLVIRPRNLMSFHLKRVLTSTSFLETEVDGALECS